MADSNVVRGNLQGSWLIGPSLSPASIAANTAIEQTFTVKGLLAGDFVNVSKPTTQAGLAIGNSRVSAADTLAIEFVNATASAISPTAAEIYIVAIDRPTNPSQALPTTLVI